MKRLLLMASVSLLSFTSIVGCSSGGSGNQTSIDIFTLTGTPGMYFKNPNQTIIEQANPSEERCVPNNGNCKVSFGGTSDNNGHVNFPTDDVPGGWFFTTYRNNNCPVDTHFQDDYVGAAEEQNLVCGVQLVQHFRTSPIYLGGGRLTPSSISVVSDTPVFNQSAGNPLIMSYNSQAQLETQVLSSNQTLDGTTITVPLNAALLQPGIHVIAI